MMTSRALRSGVRSSFIGSLLMPELPGRDQAGGGRPMTMSAAVGKQSTQASLIR